MKIVHEWVMTLPLLGMLLSTCIVKGTARESRSSGHPTCNEALKGLDSVPDCMGGPPPPVRSLGVRGLPRADANLIRSAC